jgi:Flp pilus assembly protein TadG
LDRGIGELVRKRRGFLRDSRGSMAVSFAIGIPTLLTAVFGTIELGRFGFTQAALQYAAADSTRYAIVRSGDVTTSEIEAYAASKLDGVFNHGLAVITAAAPVDPITGTSLLSVQVNYQFDFFLPFLPTGGITMSGASTGFVALAP